VFAEKDQSVLTLFLPCPLSLNYWLQLAAGFSNFSLTHRGSFCFSVPWIMCVESVKGMGTTCDSILFFCFITHLSAAWRWFSTDQSKGSVARGYWRGSYDSEAFVCLIMLIPPLSLGYCFILLQVNLDESYIQPFTPLFLGPQSVKLGCCHER